ncbi:hypothetical protein [Burkholderia anthina]|uniref:hypothetical protein n=1 Tax=Burkholderia anthina TaxID=179879 RepID=UPI001589B39D|nr:hypothetical protein [Burkholderia anthina]
MYEQLTDYAEQEIERHFAGHHRLDHDFRLQADMSGATMAFRRAVALGYDIYLATA